VADRITDNDDIVGYEVMLDVEIERLTTATLRAQTPAWASRHEMAWNQTLSRLVTRNPPVLESNLSDTDELKLACCYYVAYLAYRWSSAGADDAERAQYYLSKWDHELESRPLTIDGVQRLPSFWQNSRMLRG
jgi:hypothetical protein